MTPARSSALIILTRRIPRLRPSSPNARRRAKQAALLTVLQSASRGSTNRHDVSTRHAQRTLGCLFIDMVERHDRRARFAPTARNRRKGGRLGGHDHLPLLQCQLHHRKAWPRIIQRCENTAADAKIRMRHMRVFQRARHGKRQPPAIVARHGPFDIITEGPPR